jgi:hypothetical protein
MALLVHRVLQEGEEVQLSAWLSPAVLHPASQASDQMDSSFLLESCWFGEAVSLPGEVAWGQIPEVLL